jgi:hypothetical protein
MALQSQSIREQRRDQMYPAFDPTEIERVRKFGEVRSFAGGERLWTAGQVAPDDSGAVPVNPLKMSLLSEISATSAGRRPRVTPHCSHRVLGRSHL